MKNIWKTVMAMMLTALALAGCGNAAANGEQSGNVPAAEGQSDETALGGEVSDTEDQGGEAASAAVQDENQPDAEEKSQEPIVTNDGKGELISDEDAAALQYMKKYMVEDVYGDGSSYEVYAPEGSENSDGFLSYIDHGISFFASVFGGGDEELPYFMLNESLKGQKADWESGGQYSDVRLGEVIKNGADRYVTVSAKSEDFYGTAYEVKKLYYLDIPKAGVGVLWEAEITELQTDEFTEKILAEIGQCYGIGLESIMPSGEWVQADAERQVEAQDVYEPEAGEAALTKVDGYRYLGQTTMSF